MSFCRLLFLVVALAWAVGAQSTANCPVSDIPLTGSVEGALTADCRVSLWSDQESPIQQHRVTLTQPGTLSVDLYSSAYAPSVAILGSQRNWIASQTDYARTSHARTIVSLGAGTYFIQVASWGYSTGPYRLTTSFAPLRECAVRDLKFGDVINGDFAKTSCRQLDLQVPSADTSGVEKFRLTVEQRGLVTINVTSTLNASSAVFIRLYDAAGREVPGVPEGFDGLKLVLTVSLQPGAYLLDLRGEPQFGTGAFTLSATFSVTNPENCQLRLLRWNEEVEGILNPTGCRFMDIRTGSTDTSVTDPYMVTTTVRGVVSVSLAAKVPWFVADLLLYDRQGRQLVQKRHTGGGVAAVISASLDPGTYNVYVRTVAQNAGEYRLRAAFEPPRACEPRTLTLGQMAAGELSDKGCRVLDRTIPSTEDAPQATFRITAERRGLLSLELAATYPLEASVALTAEGGGTIATGQARGGALPARVEAGVSPGVYTVDVRGISGSQSYGPTGAFTLKTSFQELVPRVCSARDLALNETFSSSLNSANCRMLDVFPAMTSTAPVDPYRITLTEAGVVTIEMVSTEVDSYLSLLDRNLGSIGFDDNGAGSRNARVVAGLEAGTYIIHARSADAKAGSYNLTISFRPATAPVCAVESLPLVGSSAGTLSAADCRMLDLVRPSADAAAVDRYRVSVPQRGVLSLEIVSQIYPARIAVYDALNRQLTSGIGSTGRSTKVTVSLTPGDYIVFASSIGVRAGAYTLQTTFRGMGGPNCQVIEIGPGATVNASLSDAGCHLFDLVAPSSDSSLVNQYRVTLPQRGILTVEMDSSTIDPALRLVDDQRRDVASGFARRGSTSRVVATVDAAPYLIYASSTLAGPFTIRSRFQDAPAPDCSARDLGQNDQSVGAFDHGGCRAKDIVPKSIEHAYAAQYRIVLTDAGTFGAEVSSSAFLPLATLYRADFATVAESASTAAMGRSVISANLTAGEYILVVRTPAVTPGSFELRTSFQMTLPAACAAKQIGLEESVEGSLAAGDCLLADALPGGAAESLVHRYLAKVTAAGTLNVELSSGDFVPLLYLQDAEGKTLAEASVIGDDPRALLSAEVKPGSYVVLVTSAQPATGSYILRTVVESVVSQSQSLRGPGPTRF